MNLLGVNDLRRAFKALKPVHILDPPGQLWLVREGGSFYLSYSARDWAYSARAMLTDLRDLYLNRSVFEQLRCCSEGQSGA